VGRTFSLMLISMLVFRAILVSYSYFFFSSRRRHTRWPRDWSSDVCSSDLQKIEVREPGAALPHFNLLVQGRAAERGHGMAAEYRSEERRVGKECRSRWSAED